MNDSSHNQEASPELDVFSPYSDPSPYSRQNSLSNDVAENSEGRVGKARSYTEEEEEDIMLASSHPKKPTGRKKFKETRHPVYRGVRMRNSNRWVCEVREPNKKNRIWLGTYPTAEMAARAHDVASLALRGSKGCLNFADSAWRLPVPASTDSEDIQRAAAEAAEMFKPEEYDEENLNKESMKNNSTTEELSAEDNNNNVTTDQQFNEAYWQSEPPQYEQGGTSSSSQSYYLDDEAVFNMPGLLTSMAEGMLLPPPPLPLPPPSYPEDEYAEDNTDNMSLWDHSF